MHLFRLTAASCIPLLTMKRNCTNIFGDKDKFAIEAELWQHDESYIFIKKEMDMNGYYLKKIEIISTLTSSCRMVLYTLILMNSFYGLKIQQS